MDPTVLLGWVVPVVGAVVPLEGTIGSVPVEVAAIGVGVGVGTTAGVPGSDWFATEKALLIEDELTDGADVGWTVVEVEVQPRPWQKLLPGMPVTAGRPFTPVTVVLVWAMFVFPDSVVVVDVPVVVVDEPVVVVDADVVVVPVLVGLVVVSVVVVPGVPEVPGVPVVPAARLVVEPVGVVLVGVVLVAGVGVGGVGVASA
jgi:hypothetical protein